MATSKPESNNQVEELTIRDGRELKRVLMVSGYSQREIADFVGYSRSYINSVCNGISPLTLRVVEGVQQRLGEPLFIAAIKRARQVEVEERRRYEERVRFDYMEREYQREQERKRDEERRREAFERLEKEIEEDSTPQVGEPLVSIMGTPKDGAVTNDASVEQGGDAEAPDDGSNEDNTAWSESSP